MSPDSSVEAEQPQKLDYSKSPLRWRHEHSYFHHQQHPVVDNNGFEFVWHGIKNQSITSEQLSQSNPFDILEDVSTLMEDFPKQVGSIILFELL